MLSGEINIKKQAKKLRVCNTQCIQYVEAGRSNLAYMRTAMRDSYAKILQNKMGWVGANSEMGWVERNSEIDKRTDVLSPLSLIPSP